MLMHRPDQQNQSHNNVHQRVDHGIHKRKDHQNLQLRFNQRIVCLAEAQFFIYFPHTRLDDADTGNILLHDGVDLIQLRLQLSKERIALAQTEPHHAHDQRAGAQHDQAEFPVQPEHKKTCCRT